MNKTVYEQFKEMSKEELADFLLNYSIALMTNVQKCLLENDKNEFLKFLDSDEIVKKN